MPSNEPPSRGDDMISACFTLTDCGSVITKFVHKPGEPCTHSPEQVRTILDHLYRIELAALVEFGDRLSRLARQGVQFWADGEACDLCVFLHGLAKNTPNEPPPPRRAPQQTEKPSGNVTIDETFKKAPKAKGKASEQAELL